MLTPIQYLTISDFSPGVYSGFIRTGVPGSGDAQEIGAPLGAAQANGTARCIALPGGGLGPLPMKVFGTQIPRPSASVVHNNVIMNGLRVIGRIPRTSSAGLTAPVDNTLNVHVGMAWWETAPATRYRFRWKVMRLSNLGIPQWADIQDKIFNAPTPPDPLIPGVFSTTLTRAKLESAPGSGLFAVHPVIAGAYNQLGIFGYFWIFPRYGSSDVLERSLEQVMTSGAIFAHQSRVLMFVSFFSAHGSSAVVNNDMINYTDPPLSTTMGVQSTILLAESIEGFGAVGSMSSGELFLVSTRGGGLIMQGDIDFPTVVRLAGVTSTGGLSQEGAFTPVGIIYCVEGRGVFTWDGSSSSKFISPQLDPNFFLTKFASPSTVGQPALNTVNVGYDKYIFFSTWGDLVVFPNNYVLDTRTMSWWILDDAPNCELFNSDGPLLIGMMQETPAPGTNDLIIWDSRVPTTSWVWTSQPIMVAAGKSVDVREIEINVMATNTISTIRVSLVDSAGSINLVATFTPTSNSEVQRMIKKLDAPITSKNLVVIIEANSNNLLPAPSLLSINLGYHIDRLSGSYWS